MSNLRLSCRMAYAWGKIQGSIHSAKKPALICVFIFGIAYNVRPR